MRSLAVLVGVLLLSGCSVGDGEDRHRKGASPVENVQSELDQIPLVRSRADLEKLILPLDPYVDTLAHLDLLERATDVLVQRCMARYELLWPRYVPVRDPHRYEHLRRWGIVDTNEAARHGYLPPEAFESNSPPAPKEKIAPEADGVASGAIKRYRGIAVPDGGCFGEANMRLAGSGAAEVMGDVALPRRLSNEAYEYSLQDDRIVALFERWSECMKREGFHYAKPFEASGDPAWTELEFASRPTGDEIETAVADARCRHELNLVGVWYAVEAQYQARALTRHRKAIEQHGSRLRTLERRAKAVLNSVEP